MGVAVGGLRQRRPRGLYITALEGDRLFHNEGGGKFRDVTKASGIAERELRHQRRLARLRQRRQGSISSSPTMSSGRRRATCGARSTARRNPTARRNRIRARRRSSTTTSGGGKFEDVDAKAGVGDPNSEVAWHRRPRLQRRRLARPVRRQRHAAQQALSQQRERARSSKKALPPGWRLARTASRAAPWASMRQITTARGRAHLLVGNFSNQMLGLYHNEGNGLFVDEAPRSTGRPRQPAVAGVRRLLLRLRSGRLSRYLRRQRPHRRRDRARPAEDQLSAAAAAVPQCRQRQVRERVGSAVGLICSGP